MSFEDGHHNTLTCFNFKYDSDSLIRKVFYAERSIALSYLMMIKPIQIVIGCGYYSAEIV